MFEIDLWTKSCLTSAGLSVAPRNDKPWLKYISILINTKSGSRHAAHAAKALRWRTEQLLKCLIRIRTLSP